MKASCKFIVILRLSDHVLNHLKITNDQFVLIKKVFYKFWNVSSPNIEKNHTQGNNDMPKIA